MVFNIRAAKLLKTCISLSFLVSVINNLYLLFVIDIELLSVWNFHYMYQEKYTDTKSKCFIIIVYYLKLSNISIF